MTPLETRPKEKRRQRLLQGIQRMSSSPSLQQIGRARSSSSPYGTKGSLSCVSLAATSPFGQYPSGSVTPGYFSNGQSSIPGSPTAELPAFDGIETRIARKVANVSTTHLNPTTSSLPVEFAATRSRSGTVRKPPFDFWAKMPDEIRVHILSYLRPKELVRISRLSKDFHKFCFDGQLWTHFDATEFYMEIPAEALAKIILSAGPFVKELNIRGCLQIEHYERAEVIATSCKNLINATLEGCRNFQRNTLHNLIRTNEKLANLNLTSMSAVTNSTCKIISQHCPQLETLNVSWCKHMDARGVKMVVLGCPRLREVRAGEVKGFNNISVAEAIFTTNNLERLVLSGCTDLDDEAFKTMIHGSQPEIDILTDRPIVPPRRLKHLDLSRCSQLTSPAVAVLGHLVPDLQGLQLSGCTSLTDAALQPILASTPRLTHLELEELSELTNDILSQHLAKAPCAPKLEHLSVSYCENISDTGMLPIMKNCVSLKSVDMDNTRIGDLVLTEAAAMVRSRSNRTSTRSSRPHIGLKLIVYDCQMVTWTGIREILSWNAEIRQPHESSATYPTEIIGLKCFYGWQQTVEQHTQRVLKGDFAAAARLERKWADYMQAVEEAGAAGAGSRRRRRRAREAQMLHEDEQGGAGRRRARTVAAACAVM
ncbi:RNI-like protein [Annulohypoxylon truncatum]|uniref:RNI-like protein n=1 Tax=Annulohypoxylon truncatum TaxID=327061 RepID=UPI0020084BA7|nr:RNI-like protein [Annulohypoxylon truncatum]KAI1212869.1 RNI-like protein [Annulohypoxylon truncatum]